MAGKRATRPLTAEVTVQLKNGARVGVVTAAKARERYPDATIVSYGDGRPYDGPQPGEPPAKPKPKRSRRKSPKGPANATAPVTGPDVTGSSQDSAGEAPDGAHEG